MKATQVRDPRKETRTFNLHPHDIKDIQKVADAKFDGNASMALRSIIAEWRWLASKMASDLARAEDEDYLDLKDTQEMAR